MATQMQLEIFWGKLYGQPRFVKQRQFESGNCFYILVGCPQFWQFWNIEKRKMEKTTLKRESRLAKLNEVKMNGSEKKQTAKQAAKFLVSTTTFSP